MDDNWRVFLRENEQTIVNTLKSNSLPWAWYTTVDHWFTVEPDQPYCDFAYYNQV